MAKEIKVTFDNGGVYEGFANTYTLDKSITYYFSFDRDYRVQLTNNAITLQEYRNAGAWYPIDIITKFELAEISGGGGGTGDATQQWVKDNFVTKDYAAENYVKKTGDTMTGPLSFAKNNIINALIETDGNIRLYNNCTLSIHKSGIDSATNYYSAYKYNGRNTVSNIGGEDPRYRIEGYNNFVNSIECYDKITVKTEDQNTARLILSKGYLNTYDGSNIRRVYVGTDVTTYDTTKKARVIAGDGVTVYSGGVAVYDGNRTLQFNIAGSRFDIFHGNSIICHNGGGGGGSNDIQAAYKYNGIDTYNYNGITFNVSLGNGYYYNDSQRFEARGNYVNIRAMTSSGMDITAPSGYIKISDAKGVMGRSSNTENNTYITNTTQNVYVQTSQTTASSGRRDELEAILDLFRIVYNILDNAGIAGASQLASYTSDIVLWIYDNQNGVLKPTITKIRNLIHN